MIDREFEEQQKNADLPGVSGSAITVKIDQPWFDDKQTHADFLASALESSLPDFTVIKSECTETSIIIKLERKK